LVTSLYLLDSTVFAFDIRKRKGINHRHHLSTSNRRLGGALLNIRTLRALQHTMDDVGSAVQYIILQDIF